MLEFLPGEEAQVDYGQGALTLVRAGQYRRPYLFVMTLKYSGKSFRKVVWKTSQEIWARLHEEAFRAFGGCPQYVVLDNLKEGVIRPDIYAPELNPVYSRDARALRRGGGSMPRTATRIERVPWKAQSNTPRARRSKGASSTRSRRRTPGSRTGKSVGRHCGSMDARSVRCSRCTARSSRTCARCRLRGFATSSRRRAPWTTPGSSRSSVPTMRRCRPLHTAK